MTDLPESEAPAKFGPHEEAGLISLFLDLPEQFLAISEYITPQLFVTVEARYVIACLQEDFKKTGVVPSRKLLRDRLARQLTIEDPYKEILALVDRRSDPRELPFLKETLEDWVEQQIFAMLYSDEAIDAHHRGENDFLRKIVASADRLKSSSVKGFWFFEQLDELFVENPVEHISTGFVALDRILNRGGPARQEVLLYMAPTGVGKSILMCNNAFTSVLNGLNVLLVTFELSTTQTALRILCQIAGKKMDDFIIENKQDLTPEKVAEKVDNQNSVKARALEYANRGSLVIYELPPGECSVDHVYSIIDTNKKMKSWVPDVVILDYLELMVSRKTGGRNDDDYNAQKNVSTEIRGLARNENVLVISATQTNRSGMDNRQQDGGAAHINLDKSAESFGKNFPVDYVVSLNQTEEEYNGNPPRIRLWVAKNRNGPKFVSVATNIYYETMRVRETT